MGKHAAILLSQKHFDETEIATLRSCVVPFNWVLIRWPARWRRSIHVYFYLNNWGDAHETIFYDEIYFITSRNLQLFKSIDNVSSRETCESSK